jgi:hypothetical protein
MKKIYALAIGVTLALVLSVQAAVKSTDEMSKMSVSQLQTYLSTLTQEDFNQAMLNIIATNDARFIRVAIAAAQNTINAKPVADRAATLQSLLAAVPELTGSVGAGGKVLLTTSTSPLKTSKIGAQVPTASKAASTTP